jgi:hypothetical protein
MFKGENAKGRIQRPTKAYERRFSNYKIVNKAGGTSRCKAICHHSTSLHPHIPAWTARRMTGLRVHSPHDGKADEMKTETDGGFHPETTYL